jgi:hypothetical protein
LGTILRRESPRRVLDDYAEWLEAKREKINRYSHSRRGWDDSLGPPSADEWGDLNPEPDVVEQGEEHDKWEDEQRSAVQNYDAWERRNWGDYYDQWIESIGYGIFDYASPQDIINALGRNPRYAQLYTGFSDQRQQNASAEIVNVTEYIESVLHQKVGPVPTNNDWSVDMDGDNVEIRTRHLTTKDFEIVRQLFVWLREQGYDMNYDTSAHVHVGLPQDFDTFSVLALSTLVDERAIKTAVGKRSLDTWARFRDSFEVRVTDRVAEMLHESDTEYVPLSEDRLYEFIWKIADKNTGTNLRSYFDKHTVEFRYFGSNVADLDNFLSWVRYFMLLPVVAAKRREIKLGKVYFTRPENDDGIVVA